MSIDEFTKGRFAMGCMGRGVNLARRGEAEEEATARRRQGSRVNYAGRGEGKGRDDGMDSG